MIGEYPLGVEILVLGMVKGWFRLGWRMNIAEIAIIALVIVSMGIQILIARANARILREGIQYLDNNLAEALQTLVENLPEALKDQLGGAIEPINPIQAVFANMIQERFNAPINAQVIQKDATGKFTTEDTSLSTE